MRDALCRRRRLGLWCRSAHGRISISRTFSWGDGRRHASCGTGLCNSNRVKKRSGLVPIRLEKLVKGVFDVGRAEVLAVMKLDAVSQCKGDRLAVLGNLYVLCQLA